MRIKPLDKLIFRTRVALNPRAYEFCDGVHHMGGDEIERTALPEEAPTRTADISEIPSGSSRGRDSDNKVPEYEQMFGPDAPLAESRLASSYQFRRWIYRWHIRYNLTKILPAMPTPEGWRNLRGHERYHCAGWAHWEGTPQTNKAYYPAVNMQAKRS